MNHCLPMEGDIVLKKYELERLGILHNGFSEKMEATQRF